MENVDDYEYNTKDLIGHGAFAVVFRGRCKSRSDQVVAIKNISKKNLSKSQPFPDKEIEILKALHHQNVVALLHFKETSTALFMVMEYCNGGDLADYLQVKKTLSEDTICFFLRQIASAMKTLHAKGIIHRDLKPQNLLLSYKGKGKPPPPSEITIKIADFGFARFLEEDNMAATLCGSPLYMAPEVITSQQYTAKADLWSVGTIIYQCLTGKAPFKASNPQALKKFYQTAKTVEPNILPGTSKHMSDLLIRLLKRNQKDRIEFDDFFSHPFLAKRVQSTSTSPLPVPSRPSSYSSDSPDGPMSVSPVMAPISSPEDPLVMSPQPRVSSSPDPSRSPKLKTIMEKKELGSSSAGLFEEVEGDFVLVSTTRPSSLASNSSSPGNQIKTAGSLSPVVAFSKATAKASVVGDPESGGSSTPSPNSRPSSLPLSPETVLASPNQRTPTKSLPKCSSALVLHRTSPQATQMRLKVSSPTPGTTLISPGSSLPHGVFHRVSSYRASPSPPLPSSRGSSASPSEVHVQSGQLQRNIPIQGHRRESVVTPPKGMKSPSRRKKLFPGSPVSSPARIGSSPLQFQSPSSLPAIMASPAKGELSFSSTPSPSEPLNMPFASTSRRNRTYSDLTDDSSESYGENSSFRRSVSVSRLTDQNSLRTAFENLSRTPSASLEGLPCSALATTPPTYPLFFIGASGSSSRRSSCFMEGSPSSQGSITFAASPPNMEGPITFVVPELPEETLMAPEHTETLDRLNIMHGIVEAILELAKQRNDPLAESVYLKDVTGMVSGSQICFVSESQRHAEQMVLYARAMELLSAALNLAKEELSYGKLKNSRAVRKILSQLHRLYSSCFDQCSMLRCKTLTQMVTPGEAMEITADRLMYVHALELCQSSGFEEMCGNLEECLSRYHTAQMLLHGLCLQARVLRDREQLLKLKLALDQRILHLKKQLQASPYPSFP